MTRMAGEALYGGEDEYGKWGDTWTDKHEQQLKASAAYDDKSDLAQQYSGMKENIRSRVDDEEGWRQLDIDGDLKDPAKYQELAEKYSAAGFDVRAIDMADKYHSSNIAIRPGQFNVDTGGDDTDDGGTTDDVNVPDSTDTNTNTNTPTATTNITTGSGPEGAQDLLNGYVQTVAQGQDFGRDFGDNQNTIGNENQIYGNVNQGNQDFSVNIGQQGVGGPGSSGSGEGSLNNMQIAAAYGGLNEAQYQKSQALLNPYAQAQGNIAATKESTGVAESNQAANELYGGLRDLYRSQATNYMTNLFGDYFNQTDYKPPSWNPPAAPSAINPDYG